ncbi:xylulokinase [Glycomyces buryatensis]|uniref:Xylulose kinase n=1 Tax=Glycomyces buryatensis TaxID=2570927 RepID=A0A4S8QC17_9ACTN|nr:xylulokinase [Glycomyces buryatensis]THV38589.1 xylulokinase [Glycomyces buryatensis]
MALVAGVDSSTQSTKVLLVESETGEIVGSGKAPHPDGTECPPEAWWDALQEAGKGLLDRADAVAVSGQQHGMVALDAEGRVVRPALLWNDTRSAPQAERLTADGGPAAWAEDTGLVLAASFTVTKLAWMAEHEPENAAKTAAVMLPHDWLTMKLRGVGFDQATTDRSDASGTGYWSPSTGEYLPAKVIGALGHEAALPRVAAPNEIVGRTRSGAAVAPGTGDNAGAALGLGLGAGDVVVSLGTSGTVFGVSDTRAADASGLVAGFADATGRYLPLVCTLNAARVLDTFRNLLGVDHAEFDALALAAEPGADGLTLLPYLDGERTPNRPNATGVISGITTGTTRAGLARAAVEGMLSAQADGLAALADQGLDAQRVLLIGGASASQAVRRIAASVFGVDVEIPPSAEYVALGAAKQAAWALSGRAEPPQWNVGDTARLSGKAATAVSEQYSTLRNETGSWASHQ